MLEPRIRDVTERLLEPLDAAGGFDLVDALAFRLPITVICHLLGVPAEDQGRFRAWGHEVASTLEPQSTPAGERRARSSELALTAYLEDLVGRRRADPDGSLLSALVAAEEDGVRLTPRSLSARRCCCSSPVSRRPSISSATGPSR